jgi:hypothetical protein
MMDDNTTVDNSSTVEQVAAPVEAKPAESTEAIHNVKYEDNMRILRERALAAEKKAKELEKRIQEREQYSPPEYSEPRQPSIAPQVDEELSIGDEELIEGKHLKRYIGNVTKKYDRELQQIKAQTNIDTAERTLRSRYPDADVVLSEDNVNNFKTLYPEEYSSVISNPDVYARMKSAYTNIVNFGIADRKQPNRDVDRRMEDNKLKPRAAAASPSTAGDTPLSRVGDFERRVLTEDMKERIRQNLARSKEEIKYRRE